MPRFSICVSTYNDEEYLKACLDSVLSQSFQDFELIVVDDASNDGTARLLERYRGADRRVRVITQRVNGGVHLGRIAAVQAACGDYLLFLDSDDILLPGCLESLQIQLAYEPVDYLHFGSLVLAGGGVSDEMVSGTAKQANELADVSSSDELLFYCYDQRGGYRLDWRVWQRVYSADLAKSAFSLMTSDRMGRGQDAYEHFVLASMAKHPRFHNEIIGYEYHLGRGVTTGDKLTFSAWTKNLKSYSHCSRACSKFASGLESEAAVRAADGLRLKLLESIVNDWRQRLDSECRLKAINAIAKEFGAVDTAAQIMRIVRDEAYTHLISDCALKEDEEFLAWYKAARALVAGSDCLSSLYRDFYAAAESHIRDLRRSLAVADYDSQDVRIFVSTHKSVDLFESKILQPVQVGSALHKERFCWALHDDEGENISVQNPMYCELTTQYWAWKNIDASYYGFCHYRRYFDFSDVRHNQNIFGEIIDLHIDDEAQAEYCLDDANIVKVLQDSDIVTTVDQDVRSYLGKGATMRHQYDAAEKLHVEDLDKIVRILVSRHPDYRIDADKFFNGHTGCFCNMFVMKRELFHDYCEWLFPLLEEFVDTTDMSLYSREGLRTPGHLAERLLNIYLLHLQRTNPDIKIKRLQCVHFEQPDYHPAPVRPTICNDARPTIPVVFASDNSYVPMLTTTIYSMLVNASDEYKYDVTVLHRDISSANQTEIRDFFSKFTNARIGFYNVGAMVEEYDLSTNNPHISIETYYRFLIQEILPYYDKVLYLDSDLIVEGDISELYSTDLGENWLAAVPDIDFAGNLNMKKGNRLAYAKDVLELEDPYSYFQAGVLVLNTGEMRKAYTIDQWLDFASDGRYIYNDQDVLNRYCEGKVTFVDYSWNVMIDCAGRINGVFSFAPAEMFDLFLESRKSEKIIHYAGFEKPWKQAECDRSVQYWHYARQTPFYERLVMSGSLEAVDSSKVKHGRAISPKSSLRRYLDPIAPLGSKRREFGKKVIRTIRGIE